MREELGITNVPLTELYSFVYRHAFSQNMIEYEYDHVLLGSYEGKVALNPEEADDCEWVTLDTLGEDLVRRPERYAVWFLSAAPAVLRHLREEGQY